MPRRPRLIATLLFLICATPGLVQALEPVTVRVEGAVPIDPQNPERAAELVLGAALEEAVFEVASAYLPPSVLEVDEELERVRGLLGGRSRAVLLTYRRHGAPYRRPSAEEAELEELVLEITATIDAVQVREALDELGLLGLGAERPSLVFWVVAGVGGRRAQGLLYGLEAHLAERVREQGYVVVDPALHPGAGNARGGIDLARVTGAEIAVAVTVDWLPQSQGRGGAADVSLRALRASDGAELARSRFQAPGYHPDPQVAMLRALDALRDQVAENLLLQLDRNWQALRPREGAIRLALQEVSSYLQVEAVREALTERLGVARARLVEIGPRSAQIEVAGRLSAGALQDRLQAVAYPGFALEPVEIGEDRVALRVRQIDSDAAN